MYLLVTFGDHKKKKRIQKRKLGEWLNSNDNKKISDPVYLL